MTILHEIVTEISNMSALETIISILIVLRSIQLSINYIRYKRSKKACQAFLNLQSDNEITTINLN